MVKNKMAVQLLCLTADGGVPLFTKTKNVSESLPFPVVGSLNGVQMFARTHGVDLLSTDGATYRTVWKVYNDCLTLILLCSDLNVDTDQMNLRLDLIYHSLVMMCGMDDLTSLKNVERLKKHLRLAWRPCELLLEEQDFPLFCDVTSAVDMAVCPDQAQPVLQSCSEAFAEMATTSYSCLLVRGRVVVASRKWWTLSRTERVLLPMLVLSMARTSAREMLVYLPQLSPQVAHRLLVLQLVPGVDLCLLCGPKPALAALIDEVQRYWKPVFDSLKTLSRMDKRNLPNSLVLDQNLLGLIFINTESQRCISTVHPHQHNQTDDVMSPWQRRKLLRHYYRTVQADYFNTKPAEQILGDEHLSLSHRAKETFTIEDDHKCYAMRSQTMELYLLFGPEIPNHVMRSVANKTFMALIKEKAITL